MPKVAIVTNIVTPYRKKQFSLIRQHLSGTLDIYFTEKAPADRKWQVAPDDNYYFLPKILGFGRFGNLNRGIASIARNYDCVVIGGYEQPTYILLALLCQLWKVPYAVIFDGIAPRRVAGNSSVVTRLIKQWILKNSVACLANGKISRQYIRETLGLTSPPIYNQFLSVDDAQIAQAKPLRNQLRKDFIERHNIAHDAKLVLYSGRLIDRKRVGDLAQALGDIANCVLVIAGHGPEESRLRSQCADLNQSAVFLGHLESDELAKIYVLADCLVLPSTDEPWGLVVNEALFAGLAVVVSDDCGCASDLVIPDKNGFVFTTGKVTELTAKINQALSLDVTTLDITTQGILIDWNLNNSANSFIDLLHTYTTRS